MQFSCGQCGYRSDEPRGDQRAESRGGVPTPPRSASQASEEGPAELICPRCGHVIPPPSSPEGHASEETGAIPVEGAEEGFADLARQSKARRVDVVCGSCGKSLKVSARLAGKTRRCPGCKKKIRIPYPDDEEDVAVLRSALAEKGTGLDLSGGSTGPAVSGVERLTAGGVEGRAADGPAALSSEAPSETADASGSAAPPVGEGHPSGGLSSEVTAAFEPAETGESLPTAAELAAASAMETLDLDVGGPRRTLVIVAVAVLGVALLAGVAVLSHRWIISRGAPEEPGQSPVARVTGDGNTARAAPVPPVSTRPRSIFDEGTGSPAPPVPVTAPVPPVATVPVPPPPAGPRIEVAQATPDLFLAGGYDAAPLRRIYWKVAATVTAGPSPLRIRPFGDAAILYWPEGNAPCRGVLEAGAWPAQRLARRELALAAGESAKVTLVFDVPQGLSEASLQVSSLKPASARPSIAPAASGGALQAGTYVESPPRNLRPLLEDPVMAALQSAAKLELLVARQGEEFAVSLPTAGVEGSASPAGPGVYAVHLQKGPASLDGWLRTAAGGRTVVLYLQDAPFHQITFALPGTPAPP